MFDYLIGLYHLLHFGCLDKPAHNFKQLAIFYLYCLHNNRGFPEDLLAAWKFIQGVFLGRYQNNDISIQTQQISISV